MIDYLVVNMFNPSNQFNIMVYQRTKTEFKIRTQIGFNSYSNDYVFGIHELAKSCFCFLINGFSLVTNNLGFEFAYSIHSGDFSQLEDEPIGEPPLLTRCSKFRTAYEEPAEEPAEEPVEEPAEEPVEDLLIRTENIILDPKIECPWKLAD